MIKQILHRSSNKKNIHIFFTLRHCFYASNFFLHSLLLHLLHQEDFHSALLHQPEHHQLLHPNPLHCSLVELFLLYWDYLRVPKIIHITLSIKEIRPIEGGLNERFEQWNHRNGVMLPITRMEKWRNLIPFPISNRQFMAIT